MKKKLIVSNWKTAVISTAHAREILDGANEFIDSLGENEELSLIFCPPFVFLEDVARMLGEGHLEHEAELGAQDIAVSDAPAGDSTVGPRDSTVEPLLSVTPRRCEVSFAGM